MERRTLSTVSLAALAVIGGLFALCVTQGWLPDILGGPAQEELARIESPDGRSVAVLLHKERCGPALPGPEPPKTLARWARLELMRDGRIFYDSGYENLNIYQRRAFGALDVMWSPDCNRLAYRHITSFRIIDSDGKVSDYPVAVENALVTSFRWIDDHSLLVVTKTTEYPLDTFGKPVNYVGFTGRAKGIRIARLDLGTGTTERFHQAVGKPTFLFHAIDFHLDEISPKTDRVAFSDGTHLCIYDDGANKLIAKVPIPQKPAPKPELPPDYPPDAARAVAELSAEPAQLEGIWWQTNDRLLVGVGLLGFPSKAFYTFDIPSKALTDETKSLLPVWEGSSKAHDYQDADWYRSVIR